MESTRTRYISKLLGSGLTGLIQVVQNSLLARVLGPVGFGELGFVQTLYMTLFSVLDCGSAEAFFNRVSQAGNRYRHAGLIFLVTTLTAMTLAPVAVYVVYVSGLGSTVWPGISQTVINAGLVFGIGSFLTMRSVRVTDAAGVAKHVELLKIFRAAATLVGILVLVLFFEISSSLVLAVMGVGLVVQGLWVFKIGHQKLLGATKVEAMSARQALREETPFLLAFMRPMFFYSIFAALVSYLERWLLQKFGGLEQQGFFTFALQIGAYLMLFSNSFLPIFQRECAVFHGRADFAAIKNLYSKYMPAFFLLVAVPAVFLATNQSILIEILGGDEFRTAGVTVFLMLLYPIHQTTNTLATSVMFATNRIRIHLKIVVVCSLGGLVLLYFLLAPKSAIIPGLQLGSSGLALKYLVIQYLQYFITDLLICRFLGIRLSRRVLRENGTLLFIFLCACLCTKLMPASMRDIGDMTVFLQLAGAILAYLAATAFVYIPLLNETLLKGRRQGVEPI